MTPSQSPLPSPRPLSLPCLSFFLKDAVAFWLGELHRLWVCLFFYSSPTTEDNISTLLFFSVLAPLSSLLLLYPLCSFSTFGSRVSSHSLSLACLVSLSWTRTENLRCDHSGVYFSIHGGGVNWQCGDRRRPNREEMREMGLSSCSELSAVELLDAFLAYEKYMVNGATTDCKRENGLEIEQVSGKSEQGPFCSLIGAWRVSTSLLM